MTRPLGDRQKSDRDLEITDPVQNCCSPTSCPKVKLHAHCPVFPEFFRTPPPHVKHSNTLNVADWAFCLRTENGLTGRHSNCPTILQKWPLHNIKQHLAFPHRPCQQSWEPQEGAPDLKDFRVQGKEFRVCPVVSVKPLRISAGQVVLVTLIWQYCAQVAQPGTPLNKKKATDKNQTLRSPPCCRIHWTSTRTC